MKFEYHNFFIKDPKIIRSSYLGLGLLFLCSAALDFFYPTESLSTGRWSWVYRGITGMFGPDAYPIFEALIGLVFIVCSRRKS
ncbi:hypothetical protein AGMMS50256_31710 [Betaproteobacteria bacterium]|nr:hypothetical protein AGMMS50256_31710 [Betaproteobacteria bacterium]